MANVAAARPSPARFLLLCAITLVAFAGLFATMGGCEGHGKYTGQHKADAEDRMAVLKSATEWQMAHQQFLAGDLDKALKTVDRSIAINPKVTKSHVLRGRIMLEKNRLEEARREFLIAEELDPTFVEAQYYLGIVHERVNEFSDALARYMKAIELDPENPQYVVAAAEMHIAMNNLDGAEALLTQSRRTLEYNAAIRQSLGHIALLRSQPQQAAHLFGEALLLAPGDDGITEDLVQAQMACGQYADAESHIVRLLGKEGNKDRRDLKSMQAKCLIALNRPVDARTVLQELTSEKVGAADVRSWNDLGTVCAILKDKSGLRSAMQRVLSIAPDRYEGYLLKAMYCRVDNRLDDAILASNEAIKRAGKNGAPYVMKAMLLQDQAKISEAIQVLAQGQQAEPTNAQITSMRRSLEAGVATQPPIE